MLRFPGAAAAGLLLCLLSTIGCQTTRHKEFSKVQDGMDKGQVLETVGNPTRTQRWHGKDRWIYVLYPDKMHADVKEIHFQNGTVIYKGDPIPPAVSAEDQDRRNEEANRELEKAQFDAISSARSSARQSAQQLGLEPGDGAGELKQAPRIEEVK